MTGSVWTFPHVAQGTAPRYGEPAIKESLKKLFGLALRARFLSLGSYRLERMFDTLGKVKAGLLSMVQGMDPETLGAQHARDLVEDFAEIERIAAAGKALAARRVAESGAWKSDGDRSPAHWVARTTKTSVGAAVGMLETAERVAALPATDAAMRAGELSESQAREITAAATASPAAEKSLLERAASGSVSELRTVCAQVKAASVPDEMAGYERIRRRRRIRHWTDPDGAFRMDVVMTPDAGGTLLAALEPYKDRIFTEARKAGRRDAYEAYAADALVAMAEHSRDCDENPVKKGPGTMVHIRVDHSAFERGTLADGETCEIPGVGPIPVTVARDLAQDAILSALITDGVDVRAVCNLGRNIPSRLRAAVIDRDETCVVPGCDVRHGLEIDHMIPVSEGGPTILGNLDRLCGWHHYLKTHKGYLLSGGPGTWRFTPPSRN